MSYDLVESFIQYQQLHEPVLFYYFEYIDKIAGPNYLLTVPKGNKFLFESPHNHLNMSYFLWPSYLMLNTIHHVYSSTLKKKCGIYSPRWLFSYQILRFQIRLTSHRRSQGTVNDYITPSHQQKCTSTRQNRREKKEGGSNPGLCLFIETVTSLFYRAGSGIGGIGSTQ